MIIQFLFLSLTKIQVPHSLCRKLQNSVKDNQWRDKLPGGPSEEGKTSVKRLIRRQISIRWIGRRFISWG